MPLRVMQDEESANELAWWRDSSSPLQLLELGGGHVESDDQTAIPAVFAVGQISEAQMI